MIECDKVFVGRESVGLLRFPPMLALFDPRKSVVSVVIFGLRLYRAVNIEEIAPVKSRLVTLHLDTVGPERATSKGLGGMVSHPELARGVG